MLECKTDIELQHPISPVAGLPTVGFLPISEAEYIELVDWADRQLRPDKRGAIQAAVPSALRRIGDDHAWLSQMRGIGSRYWRAVGAADILLDTAREIGQRWLKGGGRVAVA